jgi:hypothetical protein
MKVLKHIPHEDLHLLAHIHHFTHHNDILDGLISLPPALRKSLLTFFFASKDVAHFYPDEMIRFLNFVANLKPVEQENLTLLLKNGIEIEKLEIILEYNSKMLTDKEMVEKYVDLTPSITVTTHINGKFSLEGTFGSQYLPEEHKITYETLHWKNIPQNGILMNENGRVFTIRIEKNENSNIDTNDGASYTVYITDIDGYEQELTSYLEWNKDANLSEVPTRNAVEREKVKKTAQLLDEMDLLPRPAHVIISDVLKGISSYKDVGVITHNWRLSPKTAKSLQDNGLDTSVRIPVSASPKEIAKMLFKLNGFPAPRTTPKRDIHLNMERLREISGAPSDFFGVLRGLWIYSGGMERYLYTALPLVLKEILEVSPGDQKEKKAKEIATEIAKVIRKHIKEYNDAKKKNGENNPFSEIEERIEEISDPKNPLSEQEKEKVMREILTDARNFLYPLLGDLIKKYPTLMSSFLGIDINPLGQELKTQVHQFSSSSTK